MQPATGQVNAFKVAYSILLLESFFAAVATQLVPPVRREPPLVAIVGFLAGIAAMIILRQLSRQIELNRGATASAGLIAASMADIFIDGVILGATFTVGTTQGILLTIALTLGLLFLGLSVATTLSQAGASLTALF